MDDNIILEAYKYIWTTEFNDYVLVQGSVNGEVDYAIYHLPRRSFLVIEDDAEDQLVIAKMLEMGIRVIGVEDLRKREG